MTRKLSLLSRYLRGINYSKNAHIFTKKRACILCHIPLRTWFILLLKKFHVFIDKRHRVI